MLFKMDREMEVRSQTREPRAGKTNNMLAECKCVWTTLIQSASNAGIDIVSIYFLLCDLMMRPSGSIMH